MNIEERKQMGASKEEVTRYLLGKMPEEEREAFAQSYFENEELYDELLFAETDLIDQYVRGQLRPAEAAAFEQYLSGLPDSQARISVAQALRISGERRLASDHSDIKISSEPHKRTLLWWALAAMFLVSLSLALTYVFALRRQLRAASAERASLETKLRSSEGRLEASKQQPNQIGSGASSQIVLVAPAVAEIDLDPDVVRDPANPITAKIPRPQIEFRIKSSKLPTYAYYSAWVQTSDGKLAWRSRPISAARSRPNLKVVAPGTIFKRGSYKLTLFGISHSGALEEAAEWYLNIG
jgi:hypothetical protein